MNHNNGEHKKDDAVIYRAGCHWGILLGPILVIVIGGLAIGSQGYHAAVLIAFGFIWGIFSYINLRRSEIKLTSNTILVNFGFPLKKSCDIKLNEINLIDYYQPSLGSLLNFGKIIIIYQGKKKCVLRFVSCPAEFVKETQKEVTSLNRP